MTAMVMHRAGEKLVAETRATPAPGPGQVLIRVHACAVCRTDLHVTEGDLKAPKLPLIPGHEVIGSVAAIGDGVTGLAQGDRLGVPWLGWTCGICLYCKDGLENLCGEAKFTGYTLDGGFADYIVADARYCFPIPASFGDVEAAPLMCAGLIGHRAYRMAGDARHVGLYGFGAAAHIIAQVAIHEGRQIYAFTKPGDEKAQAFARDLGATWAGGSDDTPPEELDAALIFAPIGPLVPAALRATAKGGSVICAGIHMSDIPQFPYDILWQERVVRSVANLTRKDGEDFLEVAPKVPVVTHTHVYPLHEANQALQDLKDGAFEGAAVLVPAAFMP
jgi:propanol-preferring alcohol dehydrogenase